MMYFEDGNTLNIVMVHLNHLNEFDDLTLEKTQRNDGCRVHYLKITLSQSSEVYDLYKCLGYSWVISPVGGGSIETEMIVGPIVGHG